MDKLKLKPVVIAIALIGSVGIASADDRSEGATKGMKSDAAETTRDAQQAGNKAMKEAKQAGNEAMRESKQAGNEAMRKSQQAGNEAMRESKQAGNAVMRESGQAANEVGRETSQAANEVSREASQAGNEVARETAEAANDAERMAETAGNKIEQGAETTAQAVERGAETAGRKIEQGAASAMQATETAANATERRFESWSDRARISAYQDEKEALEERLRAVQSRDGYQQALQDAGYRITSINEDTAESVEYEVVKGTDSYEVQMEFDGNTGKATEIDVATNIWRADSTKRAMSDMGYTPNNLTYDRTMGPRYRDSRYADNWMNEKTQLEAMLKPGMRAADYQRILTENGYQVTSINDRESDYLEFEIVKADHSYEVQIDRDPGSGLGQNVDVATNIWQSEATERALGEE